MAKSLEFEISVYPDPVLRKPAEAIEAFDGELADTIAAMFVRMRESQGVGLAAPQVGLKQRLLVLNPSGEAEDDLVLVNPGDRKRMYQKLGESLSRIPQVRKDSVAQDDIETGVRKGKRFGVESKKMHMRV